MVGQGTRRPAALRNSPQAGAACAGFLSVCQIPVLVNRTFTKEPLGQRTRFFVAERRSSLLGRGALVLMKARRRFFLETGRHGAVRGWRLASGIGAHSAIALANILPAQVDRRSVVPHADCRPPRRRSTDETRLDRPMLLAGEAPRSLDIGKQLVRFVLTALRYVAGGATFRARSPVTCANPEPCLLVLRRQPSTATRLG